MLEGMQCKNTAYKWTKILDRVYWNGRLKKLWALFNAHNQSILSKL